MIIEFFKKIFSFIKNYPGILYSLFLIFFVPISLYFYTFFSIKSFQQNIDEVLRTKALSTEEVLSVFVNDYFSQPEILTEKIQKITQENPEIINLRIIQEVDGEFKIAFSQNPQEIGKTILDEKENRFLSIAWTQEQGVSTLDSINKQRFWKTGKIISDKNNQKIALISMNLSLKETDDMLNKSIYFSYGIIFGIIVLTLFLIIHHTRLFGYVFLYKKLQELDKAKDEFIRMATHELQSPIANIKGYISVLEEEITGSLTEIQKEYFRRVNVSAKNLADLIVDILEVARIEQGRLDFTPVKISPLSLIQEVIKDIKLKAEQKNLTLILQPVNFDENIFLIKVNPNRFRQIIVNLIENAIKYTIEGEISIKADIDEAKKRYIIEIKDTGLGIAAEHQTRIFEKFYRVKTKETSDIPGTGLGLWLTKQFCEKMSGLIYMESMKGIGTKFTLIFPLFKEK